MSKAPRAERQDGREQADTPVELLLQHRHEVETERISLFKRVSKIRSGGVSLAVVLVLASFLLQRFLYVATTERWTMAALPLIVLVATGIVDLFHYRPQVEAKARRVALLEHRIRESGGHQLLPDEPDRQEEMGPTLLYAYYLVPILVLLALAFWRLI